MSFTSQKQQIKSWENITRSILKGKLQLSELAMPNDNYISIRCVMLEEIAKIRQIVFVSLSDII